MLSICTEPTVSTYGSVEIARLEKKKERRKKKMNNWQFGTSAMLLATLKVFVFTEHSSMKVRYPLSPIAALLAEFSRPPFVLLHMACLCHPCIQSLPTL